METRAIVVRARWDPDANVWVATSDDVPGLVTEAVSHKELLAKVQVMIPDLLDDDEARHRGRVEVPLFLMSEQLSMVSVPAA